MKNQEGKDINIKNGSHFWGLLGGRMAVFIKSSKGEIYIAGGWEGSINESEITFVEYIKNPKPEVTLYYN